MFRIIIYLLLIFLLFGCSKVGSSKNDFILFSNANRSKVNSSNNWSKADSSNKLKPIDSKKDSKASIFTPPQFNNVRFKYKIVPNDRASIIVYKHPELSSTTLLGRSTDRGILINSEGDIKLPLVKSIHVEGLTQTEAQEEIENAFKKYLKSPDIYFEILNKRAYVIGEVNSPGEIELLNEKLTLLQILSKAGDLKDSADKRKIMILRSGKDKVNSEMVNLVDFNSLKMANLMIKPNDIVYVLPKDISLFNKKIDEVSPIVRLIGSILSPFITLKILSK